MSEKSMVWTGWVLSALFILFMLGASVYPKLSGMAIAPDTMTALGWANSPILLIGTIELVCTLLYIIPFTSILGAILMMGVLGGAITTQLRAGSPLFSHTLFGIYLGLVMWGGLWLRDAPLRALFPFRRL
jgi:DoxX-like family